VTDLVDQLRAMAAAALAPVDGDLAVPGLAARVTILRDRWGVPSIDAASQEDLWFAQGFVTAGERLFQLDLALRAANGRLSEVFADRTLAQDRFARVVGFRRAGKRIADGYDDESRTMMRRFREGVVAWVTQMPARPVEYVLLDLAPDLPDDDASWAAPAVSLAWSLSGNAQKELLRAAIAAELGSEAVLALLPPLPGDATPSVEPVATPSTAPGGAGVTDHAGRLLDAMDGLPPSPGGRGSNAWTVAGRLTASGLPLLANDPHLEATQPGAWLELHLRAPGYEARGVALPFSPGVILGATPHHAWGVTNVTGDVQDLYLERVNEDRTAALHDDRWEPLTVHTEEIAVRGSGEPVTVSVLESRHGPLLESFPIGDEAGDQVPLAETYALRWTGHERSIRPSAFVRAAQAQGFEGFREAVRHIECPGQNFVYADVEGTIGYQCTGAYPVRRRGDGTAPVPGWTSEHEWDGWIPFEDLPNGTDPDRGFLVTANDRPEGGDGRRPIGRDFHTPYRARRITARLADGAPHDVASTAAVQTDTVSLPAREVLERIRGIRTDDPHVADAMDLLLGWDGDLATDSIAAGLYEVWVQEMARAAVGGRGFAEAYLALREPFACQVLPATAGDDPEAVLQALRAALERLGPERERWRWGKLHAIRLVHPLGRMPGLESLFTAAEVPLGGDEQTVLQGGFDGREDFGPTVIPSWRAVWDLGDLDRSVTVLPSGTSGNPASPHWNDQTELWAAGGTKPAPVTWPAVQASAVSALRLSPG
jgi:penicillin G amidase